MTRIILTAAAVLFAGCTAQQQSTATSVATLATPAAVAAVNANPRLAKFVAAVCQKDIATQPIVVALAVPVATAAAPGSAAAVAGAVALDQAAIHPAIAAACAQVGGTAVGGVPAALPAEALNGVR